MKRILTLAILSVLVALGGALYLQVDYPEYKLVLFAKCQNVTSAQLFYDLGEGFEEKNSAHYHWLSSEEYQKVSFALPPGTIKGLRLDPFETSGSIEIKKAYLLQDNGNMHDFDLAEQLIPSNDLNTESQQEKSIHFEATQTSSDPIILFKLNEPLYGWSLKGFSILEWSIDALVIFLAMAPLIWSLTRENGYPLKGSILFRSGNENVTLENGHSYSRKPRKCYRDAPEDTLFKAKERIERGESWKSVLTEIFKDKHDWLLQITTSDLRNKFLKERKPKANDLILDIGAGWGQFSIPLAKSNKICSLEPTPERHEFIKAVAKQEQVDQNMFFIGADYLDIEFESKFDLILCIGVLEWVGSFRDDAEPSELQLSFLKKARQELNFGGRMVIGIENRIGLKYLMGAPDDHTGLAHISYLEYDSARKKHREKTKEELRCFTYGMEEYKNMLTESGFTKIQFFAALPDYKLPVKIFPIEKNKCPLNDFVLEGNVIKEHNGLDGSVLPNQSSLDSTYKTLASMNVAHHFAPSFYVEAS
jgi:2-polyprenyl-3-methyl-5-hydroxy-6-metoxy-1,4-benzoquinol methylase